MSRLSAVSLVAPSLADPASASPLAAAVRWIEGVALGSVATSIALIAVASVGVLMFTGRMPVRRGATVIAGCFILFGAPLIARGIQGMLQGTASELEPNAPAAPPPLPPLPSPTAAYDPYAGAAVPPR